MFTTQQQQVLDLISEGESVGLAADSVGVHRNTLSNWRRASSDYQSAWDLAHYDQVMTCRDRAVSLAHEAIAALHDIMGNSQHPPGARIRAALAVLQRAETMPSRAPIPPPAQPACAPQKIETLAQFAQSAVAPDSIVIPVTTDRAVTCEPSARPPQVLPICTTEPEAPQPDPPIPTRLN